MGDFLKKDKCVLFLLGSVGYGLIEVIWRGKTHPSMLLAGGICFSFFSGLNRKLKDTSFLIKAIIGSSFITSIELLFGFIFNILLKKQVWDYSKVPLNILGQICLPYSLLWLILSMFFIPFSEFTLKKINNKTRIVL